MAEQRVHLIFGGSGGIGLGGTDLGVKGGAFLLAGRFHLRQSLFRCFGLLFQLALQF